MKQSILFFCLAFLCNLGMAQEYKAPSKSPRQKIVQQFSVSEISVDYGRPSVRNRVVFGELVPYGKIWRLGANESTNITFGQDMLFAGQKISAGTYSLYAIPTEKAWTLIVNSDTENWGAYGYKEENDLLRVEVPTANSPTNTENLTFSFEQVSEGSAELQIAWAQTHVKVPLEIGDRQKVRELVESLTKKK